MLALHPELQVIDDLIKANGWAHGTMPSDPTNPNSKTAFAFTVGLDEKFGLPELICYGLKDEVYHGTFLGVIEQLVAAGGWTGKPTRLDGVLNEVPVELRSVDPQHVNLVAPHNREFRKATGRPPIPGMVQIFWPGSDGRFQWDPNATDAFPDQKRLDIPWPTQT